jgi:Xaa-Pro aminopeptidase
MTRTTHTTRLTSVRRELKRLKLPALLISHPANLTYMTGFRGSDGMALLTADRLVLVVDFRYVEQAREQAPGAEILQVMGADYDDALAEGIRQLELKTLAFEADALEVSRHMALTWRLPELALIPSRGIVEREREVKDEDEIARIRRAANITGAAIVAGLAAARPGVSERAIAAEVEAVLWQLGAEGPAFPTLVASGPRAALPHPRPGDRRLEAGDWLLIDAGAVLDGYRADMSRTVVLGEPDARQREAWSAVQAALTAGLAAVKPGARAGGVDRACREVLKKRGWDAAFGHDTGHGVGLDLHEGPRLAPGSDDRLEPGMVITVEPGVYVPGWGGVRLEQLVLVTPSGAELLTKAPVTLAAPCGSVLGRL